MQIGAIITRGKRMVMFEGEKGQEWRALAFIVEAESKEPWRAFLGAHVDRWIPLLSSLARSEKLLICGCLRFLFERLSWLCCRRSMAIAHGRGLCYAVSECLVGGRRSGKAA